MSLFKEPFSEKVRKTLQSRQTLMGKENRTPNELKFLNSKTNWVTLKSAIDITTKEQDNWDDYSDISARNHILRGGTLDPGGNLRNPFSTNEKDGAYSRQNYFDQPYTRGIRPMAGITSVKLESLSPYGSLRRATVEFQCWDVKQLDILEQLYMRPGYLVFLEFGNSIYLNENGNINPVLPSEFSKNFFSKKNINLLETLKEIYKTVENSGGNYDALLGYVSNYKWTARDDGGFDCMTEIVSTGEVLESIKANYSLASSMNFEGLDINNPNFKGLLCPYLNDTSLTNIGLKSEDKNNLPSKFPDQFKLIVEDYSSNLLAGLIRELYFIQRDILQEGKFKISNFEFPEGIFSYSSPSAYYQSEGFPKLLNGSNFNSYIDLDSFLDLINKFIVPYSTDSSNNFSGPITKISVKDREYLGNSKKLNCLYNELMISVNPNVCLIKNNRWTNLIKGIKITDPIVALSVIPSGDELEKEGEFRDKLNGWIKQLASGGIPAEVTVLGEIYYHKEEWLKNNPDKTEQDYYYKLQRNFQTFKAGTIPESIVSVETPAVDESGAPITITVNQKIPAKNTWQGITDNNLKIELNKKYDTVIQKFGDLFFYEYYGVYANRGIVDLKTIANVRDNLKNVNIDENLNTYLDNNILTEEQITKSIEQINEINEINTNIKKIGINWERFTNNELQDSFYEGGGSSSRKKGIIGNIYLNLKYLYSLATDSNLKSKDPEGKDSLLLSRFIISMMKEVQKSIGGVNDFELHIDDRDGIGRIIDLNYIQNDTDPFLFEIGTNKSIIRNLRLESKIYSNQIAMYTIAAQSDSGRLGMDNSTIATYNTGIQDRLLPKKDSFSLKDKSTEANNLISNLSSIINNFFKPWMRDYYVEGKDGNAIKISNENIFDENNVPQYTGALKNIITYLTNLYNTDNKSSALLPTEVSFSLDGIAGVVIGNIFKLDTRFIPKSYSKLPPGKELIFTVTKVDHSLQENDWVTNISALPVYKDNGYKTVDIDVDFTVIISYNVVQRVFTTNSSFVTPSGILQDTVNNISNIYNCKNKNTTINPEFLPVVESIFSAFKANEKTSDIGITITSGTEFRGGTSKHNSGWALDFVISDEKKKTDFINIITETYSATDNKKGTYNFKIGVLDIDFIDEYDFPSNKATGKHFHIEVNNRPS